MAPEAAVERPFRVTSRSASPLEYLVSQSLVAHLADPLPKDKLFVQEALMALTRSIVAGGIGREPPKPVRDLPADRLRQRLPQLLSHLNDEASRELKFADLVALMRCSPWYLSRVFSEEVGVPIFRYVRRLRVRRALDRILDGATSLTDVALDAGFASHSNFTRAFHEEFGAAPSGVRDRTALKRVREVVSRLGEAMPRIAEARAKPAVVSPARRESCARPSQARPRRRRCAGGGR
jgi:AraC-like DNA-binding protein